MCSATISSACSSMADVSLSGKHGEGIDGPRVRSNGASWIFGDVEKQSVYIKSKLNSS